MTLNVQHAIFSFDISHLIAPMSGSEVDPSPPRYQKLIYFCYVSVHYVDTPTSRSLYWFSIWQYFEWRLYDHLYRSLCVAYVWISQEEIRGLEQTKHRLNCITLCYFTFLVAMMRIPELKQNVVLPNSLWPLEEQCGESLLSLQCRYLWCPSRLDTSSCS